MKNRTVKIEISDERNELGSLFIERLIERMLMEHFNMPIYLQAQVLHQKYRNEGELDE
jgi:hypothetical protein